MNDNEYRGPVYIEGMVDFLHTLEGEIELSQSSEDSVLMDDVGPDTAAEYLEGIVEEEANGSATPWDDYDGYSLLDPESLEPWETGESYTGRLQLQSQELTENGISYRFDFIAEDEEGEQWDISMIGVEEDYQGTGSDVSDHARMSNAFTDAGI